MTAATAHTYGGQALIEGVMIRGATTVAMAARMPGGEIATRSEATGPAGGWRTVPFVRGVIALVDAFRLGLRSLYWSASIAGMRGGQRMALGERLLTLAAIVVAAAVFVAGPVLATGWLEGTQVPGYLPGLAEGTVRVAMVVGYVWFIGRLPEVRRVFAYHGAEHRAVHAYEHGRALSVDSLREFPDAHPRCGTAFVVTVGVLSLAVFMALGTPALWVRVVERIVLLPVIAGVAYEFLRLSQAHEDAALIRLLAWPNLAMQHFTTREPDDAQLEVAIAAMREALRLDAMLDEPVSAAVQRIAVPVESDVRDDDAA